MSREIKFRAWHKKRKKFYEVLHLHLKTICNGGMWATGEGYDIISHQEIHVQIQPNDCIIQQYTGLKDNQGKEIYEGDIITLTYGIPSTSDRLIIEYSDNEVLDDIHISGWWMRNTVLHRHSSSLCKTYEGDLEIIGNIYENPELLVDQ